MRRPAGAPSAGPDGARAVPPADDVGRGVGARSWLRTNLEHSLPFLVGGGVCIGLAAWMDVSQLHVVSSRLSLWTLFAAVGLTLGGGGVALTLVEEPPVPGQTGEAGDYVLVARAEWEEWRAHQESAHQPWSESTEEEVPVVPAPEPVELLPTTSGPAGPPGYDATLVARASADLLEQARSPTTPVPPTQGSPTAAPVPTGGSPDPRGPAPATRPTGPSKEPTGTAPGRPPAPPAAPPAWQEEPNPELESVLQQLEHAAALLPSARTPRPAAAPVERCVSCGGQVTAYSEQSCVVCERPMCDTCLEQSVVDGRPSVCPTCPRPRGD